MKKKGLSKKQTLPIKKLTNILNYTENVVRGNSDKINFAFADPNRNLKIRIIEPANQKSTFVFKDRGD